MRRRREATSEAPAPGVRAEREPRWWHRDHPEAAALGGFFVGVLTAIVVPGAYATLLGLLFGARTTESLFPLVLVVLLIPFLLQLPARTRRFGRYMLLGIVLTVLVVVGVAAAVLWFLGAIPVG